MKNLKTLKADSEFTDFFKVFQYNSELVGRIAINPDIRVNFIKVLCIFPLKDKKLKYFLKLDPKAKTGYMSSYIMKIAKQMNVSQSLIKLFQETKESAKFYNEIKPSTEEVGNLLKTDFKEFLYEYKKVVKDEIYLNELSKMTNKLCSAIFEQFDKVSEEMINNNYNTNMASIH